MFYIWIVYERSIKSTINGIRSCNHNLECWYRIPDLMPILSWIANSLSCYELREPVYNANVVLVRAWAHRKQDQPCFITYTQFYWSFYSDFLCWFQIRWVPDVNPWAFFKKCNYSKWPPWLPCLCYYSYFVDIMILLKIYLTLIGVYWFHMNYIT